MQILLSGDQFQGSGGAIDAGEGCWGPHWEEYMGSPLSKEHEVQGARIKELLKDKAKFPPPNSGIKSRDLYVYKRSTSEHIHCPCLFMIRSYYSSLPWPWTCGPPVCVYDPNAEVTGVHRDAQIMFNFALLSDFEERCGHAYNIKMVSQWFILAF